MYSFSHSFALAGAVGLGVVASSPASAALFTYEFSTAAGGASASSFSIRCTASSCTGDPSRSETGLTLSGTFTVDTSKLTNDFLGGADGFYYDVHHQPPAAQFLTASMTATGGTIDLGSGTGGGRSYLYGYSYGANDSFFQAYAQSPEAALGARYEYRADGTLERVHYREDYVTFYLYDDFDVSQIEGMDLATALPLIISNGYAQMGYYAYEYFYNELGQYVGRTERGATATGRLALMNAHPGGPTTVPEPAVIGLFGLGFGALAASRRRNAARRRCS